MARQPQKILGATFAGTLAVQTVGTIDDNHKLPPPRVYVGVFLLWFILGLLAAAGDRIGRVAATFSVLILLLVVLTKGRRLVTQIVGFALRYASADVKNVAGSYPSDSPFPSLPGRVYETPQGPYLVPTDPNAPGGYIE